MDRLIPTYEEVRVIVGVMLLVSLFFAMAAGWVFQREGQQQALLAVFLGWLSAFLMLLALTGDVMFSILRVLEAQQ